MDALCINSASVIGLAFEPRRALRLLIIDRPSMANARMGGRRELCFFQLSNVKISLKGLDFSRDVALSSLVSSADGTNLSLAEALHPTVDRAPYRIGIELTCGSLSFTCKRFSEFVLEEFVVVGK